jgi:hypothetical protein
VLYRDLAELYNVRVPSKLEKLFINIAAYLVGELRLYSKYQSMTLKLLFYSWRKKRLTKAYLLLAICWTGMRLKEKRSG